MQNGFALSTRPTHHAGGHRGLADERLVARVAAGDRLAMEALYARHHLLIYRFVLRLVNDAATAEDLTSDVFLDVWKQAGRFEGRSQVSTWMLAIARYKAMSTLRRQADDPRCAHQHGTENDDDEPLSTREIRDRRRTAERGEHEELPGLQSCRGGRRLGVVSRGRGAHR